MKKYTVEFIGTKTFLADDEKSLDQGVTNMLNAIPTQLKARAKVIKIEEV
tara:strand:- start:179 stop:328 length:150 start_codon:yes stop_codon:yes gene_type:complete